MRQEKLQSLNDFLLSGTEDFNMATALERYFTGESTSTCQCKFSYIKSRLNQLWEQSLKQEYNDNLNNQDNVNN